MTEISTGPVGAARLDLVVLDCPNPSLLAAFYASILGWEVTDDTPSWATIRDTSAGGAGVGMGFQCAEDYVAPTWPRNDVPQQSHLDLTVTDFDTAEAAVLAAGATATALPGDDTRGFRVYRDPVGHPFCLCL